MDYDKADKILEAPIDQTKPKRLSDLLETTKL